MNRTEGSGTYGEPGVVDVDGVKVRLSVQGRFQGRNKHQRIRNKIRTLNKVNKERTLEEGLSF